MGARFLLLAMLAGEFWTMSPSAALSQDRQPWQLNHFLLLGRVEPTGDTSGKPIDVMIAVTPQQVVTAFQSAAGKAHYFYVGPPQ